MVATDIPIVAAIAMLTVYKPMVFKPKRRIRPESLIEIMAQTIATNTTGATIILMVLIKIEPMG